MEWSAQNLYDKSRLYMDRAQSQPVNSELFALWVSLSLELLCRAALAKLHPVLLADPREDGSILYAFGVQPAKPPKSVVTKAIVNRCRQLVEGFTQDMAEHCALMAEKRNLELHSGVIGFEEFENAAWLPATYEVVEVLLKHLGFSFDEFLGADHAATAIGMLRDRRETIKREVLQKISRAKKYFGSLSEEEKENNKNMWEGRIGELENERSIVRQANCPACKSSAVMTGEIVGRGPVRIDESKTTIEREVRVLPTKFTCPYCRLSLNGFQEMHHAQLGSVYTILESEDPVDFFRIDPSDYIDTDEYLRDYFAPDYDNE